MSGVAEEAAEVCADACVGVTVVVGVNIVVRMSVCCRCVFVSADMDIGAGYGEGVRTRFHRVLGTGTRFGDWEMYIDCGRVV